MRYVLGLVLVASLLAGCGDLEAVPRAVQAGVGEFLANLNPTTTPTPPVENNPSVTPTQTPIAIQAVEDARKHVIRIDRPDGCGSGVLLGTRSLILTNYHVVRGAETLLATTENGTQANLTVLTFDLELDLALLQADSTLPEPAPLIWANDVSIKIGTPIIVLGYPFPSSKSPSACSESLTVTRGVLSSRLTIRGQPLLQTDAALNKGVSGGLAITDTGLPVGLAVSGLKSSAAENVGFLIPSSEVEARSLKWQRQLANRSVKIPTPPPTPTPTIPNGLQSWLRHWEQLRDIKNEQTDTLNRLAFDDIPPNHQIEAYKAIREKMYSDDGMYGYVFTGNFPRFREVRTINDAIVLWVESHGSWITTYIRYIQSSGDARALSEKANSLRILNNQAWRNLRDAVEDLRVMYGLDAATYRPQPTATPQQSSTRMRSLHTVRSGDTLSEIASRYGVTTEQVATFNSLCTFETIHVGQELRIPRASYNPQPMACPTPAMQATAKPAVRWTPPPPQSTPTPTPAVAWVIARVLPNGGVNVRVAADPYAAVAYVAPGAARIKLTSETVVMNGVTWWRVDDTGGNWVQGQFLRFVRCAEIVRRLC